MRIDFTRTGGLAGMRISKSFDSSIMHADQAGQLSALVESAGFFNLPAKLQSTGADQLHCKLAVVKDGNPYTIDADERAVPATLAPLVQHLMAAAPKP